MEPKINKENAEHGIERRQVNDQTQLTQAAGEITGRRWCGYHQDYADAQTGQFIERNGKRWMCRNCLIRRGIVAP